jgi:hypothetical protein
MRSSGVIHDDVRVLGSSDIGGLPDRLRFSNTARVSSTCGELICLYATYCIGIVNVIK